MLHNDKAFTELKSLRKALLEQIHFNSTLKDRMQRSTQIQLKLKTTLNEIDEQLQLQVSFERSIVIH